MFYYSTCIVEVLTESEMTLTLNGVIDCSLYRATRLLSSL